MPSLMDDMEEAGYRVPPCRDMKRYLPFPVILCGMAAMGSAHELLTSLARSAAGQDVSGNAILTPVNCTAARG
jgi:hypothetical protein